MNKLLLIIRIILGKGKRAFREIQREAAMREQLSARHPFLLSSLEAGVNIDATSTIGLNVAIGSEAVVLQSTLGNQVSIGKQVVIDQSILGANVRIEPRAFIYQSILQPFVLIHAAAALRNSRVQSYSYIGSHCSLENTSVGKFCSIAQNLICAPGNHPTHMLSTSPAFYLAAPVCGTTFATEDAYDGRSPCTIGNDVWIGANVFIKGGTCVGDGAIIAAGSVVVKDVAPYTIVAGVPAKEIRKRYAEPDIATLQRLKWWDWPEHILRQATPFIQQGNLRALEELGAEAASIQSLLQ